MKEPSMSDFMENPWKIIAIVFIILFSATAVICICGISVSDVSASPFMSSSAPNATANAETAMNFISTNLVSSGTAVSLVNVTEESGLDKLTLNITTSDGQQQILSVFVSKDGKYLFPMTFQMSQLSQSSNTASGRAASTPSTQSAAQSCSAVTKQDSPVLEAFVVSYCPYGQQMQKVLADVVSELPTIGAHIKVRYIGAVSNGTVQSMHGPTEAAENLRQICIREEQPDLYWKYVSCFLNSTSSAACVNSTGVDTTKLAACTGSADRGLAYAAKDFGLSDSYGVTGSPTLVLNGATVSEFNFGGRTPEAIKSVICCGFTDRPDTCNTTLSSSSSTSSGNCG